MCRTFTLTFTFTFIVSCQFLEQTIRLSTAFCRGFEPAESVVILLYKITSSAYNSHVTGELKRNPRSFTKRMNNRGPITLPWAIPLETLQNSEK